VSALTGRGTLARHGMIGGLALAVGAAVLLFVDAFTDFELAAVAIFAVAAAGLTVLVGLNGQLSLGHGALMAIGAYTAALLWKHFPGLPAVVVASASVLVTSVSATLVGAAAARLRGPYLAGATLALAVGLPGVTIRFADVFGGDQGIPVPPLSVPAVLGSGFPVERWLALVSLLVGTAVFIVLANLKASRLGRDFRAVRDDEVAAQLAGIHVARTQVLAFVISGACAGLAGAMFATWAGVASPSGFGLGLSLQLLAMVVIGGLGTLSGAALGALGIVYLPEVLNNLTRPLQLPTTVRDNLPIALYGAALIFTMMVFPTGIRGAAGRLAGWTRGLPRRD
jgi:branched-chain amino acid transport system permease protein